ncbi:MAG: TetR/AcrR family transcriptional regulator [Comamonas sp.]|jgi:AcrR family transcriptional regulator|nr:TetR/AcrR family transcriptional regulator [Comamonas sp.]
MPKKGASTSYSSGDAAANAPAPSPARQRTPRGPSPQKTEATRHSIVDAAFAEFLEQGYARGTTASVARRAGLSKVTLFRYFESKESLFDAVMQRHIASAALALQSSTLQADETVGAFLLRTVAPAMDEFDRSGRAATARLVVTEGLEFPQLPRMYRQHVLQPMLAHFRTLAELAQSRGELKDARLQTVPELLLGPLWLAMAHNTVLQPEAALNTGALFRMQVQLLFDCAPQRNPAPATH